MADFVVNTPQNATSTKGSPYNFELGVGWGSPTEPILYQLAFQNSKDYGFYLDSTNLSATPKRAGVYIALVTAYDANNLFGIGLYMNTISQATSKDIKPKRRWLIRNLFRQIKETLLETKVDNTPGYVGGFQQAIFDFYVSLLDNAEENNLQREIVLGILHDMQDLLNEVNTYRMSIDYRTGTPELPPI